MRSRCFGSMFACILNMKPENVCVSGVTIPSVVGRDLGGGAISIKQSVIL